MAFSHTNLAQARTALRERLNDPSSVFWSDAELNVSIIEALRAWGITAGAFRERGQMTLSPNVVFYDVNHLVSDNTNAYLLGRDVTDREIVNAIQYHLAEPANDFSTSSAWAGTEQFTLSDLISAIQRRRNQYLLETRQVLDAFEYSVSNGVDTVYLADNVMDVRRAAWIDVIGGVDSSITNLWKTDEFSLSSYNVGWGQTPAPPQTFTIATVLDTTLRLAPTPNNVGRLHLLAIRAASDLDVTIGVSLNVPDGFTQVIKWGALGDLLSKDGPAKDAKRAEYCEQRWQEGIALANIANTVLYSEIEGNSAQIVSLFDLDSAYPGWQLTTGTPSAIAIAGATQLAVYPVPTVTRTIVLDVTRNAPIPSLDGDFIQVGREYLDIILDYAQHLATFKEGGTEFEATMPHFDRFMRAAARYNDRLRANAGMFSSLSDNVKREEEQRPLFVTNGN